MRTKVKVGLGVAGAMVLLAVAAGVQGAGEQPRDLGALKMIVYGASPIAEAVLDHEVNGRVATRMGNASPHACPHGVFRAAGEERRKSGSSWSGTFPSQLHA